MARRALMAHFLGIGLLALAGCAGAGETDVPTSTTAPTAAPVPTSTPGGGVHPFPNRRPYGDGVVRPA